MSVEGEAEILDAFSQLDEIEQMVFFLGVKALSEDRVSLAEFQERVGGLIGRHRAGDDLRTCDLECLRTP